MATNDRHTGEIIMYQPDETVRLEVRVENETVWLSQQQMADLFVTTKQNVSLHVKNIYDEGELEEKATVKDYLTVQKEGSRTVSARHGQHLSEKPRPIPHHRRQGVPLRSKPERRREETLRLYQNE